MRFKFLLILLLPFSLMALETQPYLGDIYEFYFLSKYTYSNFRKVQGAIDQLTKTDQDHLVYFDLAFCPSMQWGIDFDLELTETPRQSFGFRSAAFQLRYLWLDDIIGDPITLTSGANIRATSSDSLRDVSTPYHSNVDIEGNIAIGKEFSKLEYWRFRIWGYGAVGIANQGSPWFKGLITFEGNSKDVAQWALFVETMHSYGNRTYIDIADFYGYGRIRQKNIDIGARMGFKMSAYGTLSFEYRRRVFAKRFPKNVNFFSVSYLLPFSF